MQGNWMTSLLALVSAGILGGLYRAVRGTTLWGPWSWALASLLALAFVEAAIRGLSPLSAEVAEAWRFLAAALTCCPGLAWLGAKRPQHHMWQFVVASFWGIMVLPVAELLVLRSSSQLVLPDFRAWLLGLFVLLAVVNFLPTRFGASSLFWGGGQTLLLGPHLPLVQQLLPHSHPMPGVCLLLLAVTALLWPWPARQGHGRERVWREFRDRYGFLWSLRIAERFNSLARQQHWPVQLGWNGFQSETGRNVPAEKRLAADACFRSLLRRFVSAAWIERQGGESEQAAGEMDHGPTEGSSAAPPG